MPSNKKIYKPKNLKNKDNGDFKTIKTKVGEVKVNAKLTDLSLQYKTLKQISQNENTPEHLMKQTQSANSKNRKDAFHQLKFILQKTPEQLIPVRSNFLLQCIFKSLHDSEVQVFTAAAELLSYISEEHFDILSQYKTLFQINLKLILNQSFFDNKRAFIKNMTKNMTQLCEIIQVPDFIFCLQDEMVAPKVVVLLIWILEQQNDLQLQKRFLDPQCQWGLISLGALDSQKQDDFILQNIHQIFKTKNILQPLLLKHDVDYLISLLVLVYYVQTYLEVNITQEFKTDLIAGFPYTQGQQNQELKEKCFVLNSLFYLITNLTQVKISTVQHGRKFDIKQILNIHTEALEIDVIEYIQQSICIQTQISQSIFKCLLKKQFKQFEQYIKYLDQEDIQEILNTVVDCSPGLLLQEISKNLLRKQYERANQLIKTFNQRFSYYKINNLPLDIEKGLDTFIEIKIGEKTAYPKQIAVKKCQSVYLDQLLNLLDQ